MGLQALNVENHSIFQLSEQNIDRLKVAGKVIVVALVIAGLVAATVFTFGAAGAAGAAAIAATGSGSAGSVFTGWVATGALFGTGLGLGISTLAVPYVAYKCDMFKATEDNMGDIGKFLAVQTAGTAVITGYCALAGANDGMKYGTVAVIFGAAKKKH